MPRIFSGSTLGLLFALTWSACGILLADGTDGKAALKTKVAVESARGSEEAVAEDVSDPTAEDESKAPGKEKQTRSEDAKSAPAIVESKETSPAASKDVNKSKPASADDSKKVVADFADVEKTPGAGHKNAAAEPRLSFNFRFAPWDLVLKRFAEEARLTLDMNEVPPGTFNYYDNSTYTVAEALDIVNGYLLQKGFILVRRHKFLVVVNIANGIQPNLIPRVSLRELPQRGRNELMSVVIPLGNIDAKSAAEEIKDLLGPYPQGTVLPLVKTNQLFVTDIGANLQEIAELLDGMGAVQEKKESTFRSFKLVHISATEAERMLRELFSVPARGANSHAATAEQTATRSPGRQNGGDNGFQGRGGNRGGGGGFNGGGGGGGGFRGGGRRRRRLSGIRPASCRRLLRRNEWRRRATNGDGTDRCRHSRNRRGASARMSIAIDPRQNSLLVTCSVEDMRLVEDFIKTIDVAIDASEARGQFARGANVPQLEVYALENADPAVVVDMLYATVPGLLIREDSKSRRINVYATPSEQQQVRNIVKQIDSAGGETIATVQLRHWEAPAAAASLRALFTSASKGDPPSIEADAASRRLMIRGAPDQVAQIKKLLVEMGEDGSIKIASEASGSGPVRAILPRGRSAAEVLALVERLLPQSENNFIRIVSPSAIGGPAFQRRDPLGEPEDKDSSQFRRNVPRASPASQVDKQAPAGLPSDVDPEADVSSPKDEPQSRERPARTSKASKAAPRFPLGVFPKENPLAPARPVPKPKSDRAATESGAPGGKAETELEELSRQLEDALRGQVDDLEEDGSQDEPSDDEAPAARKVATTEEPRATGEIWL